MHHARITRWDVALESATLPPGEASDGALGATPDWDWGPFEDGPPTEPSPTVAEAERARTSRALAGLGALRRSGPGTEAAPLEVGETRGAAGAFDWAGMDEAKPSTALASPPRPVPPAPVSRPEVASIPRVGGFLDNFDGDGE